MLSDIRGCFVLLVVCLRPSCWALPAITDVTNERHSKSQQIQQYMNTSVDPCEDFYEFVCGKYADYHSAAEMEQPTMYMLQEMQLSLGDKISQLLLANDDSDTEVDKKVKTIYRSCLKLPEMFEKDPDMYLNLTSEFGKMPLLAGAEWQEDEFDWAKTVADIKHKYGIDILTEFVVTSDFTNKSLNGLYIAEPALLFQSKSLYIDEEYQGVILLYTAHVAENLITFLRIEENVAMETAKDIVAVEVALAKGLPDSHERNQLDKLYTPTTAEKLQEKYMPAWNINEQIVTIFGALPPFQLYINEEYQQNLVELLKNTSKRSIANYVHYKLFGEYFTIFSMEKSSKKIQETCISDLKKHLAMYFDNLIYRKYNLKETEGGVNEMWQHIKSAFRDALESERLSWQNEVTRKVAMEKLDVMELAINSYEDYDFTRDLGDANVNEDNFPNNLQLILAAKGKKTRNRINEPPQSVDYSHITTTSPAYIVTENEIQIPVYVLQPYYVWSAGFPNAYNFGVLGSMLAHELIHGFDDNGREFDAHGNVKRWWDEESSTRFEERSKCFTNQYKQYVFGGRNLPEINLQMENIADNGGVRVAYEAYLKWYTNAMNSGGRKDLETFSDFNYNNKQLFFISHAHLWCSDTHPQYIAIRAADTHTPEKFRVIGALSNAEEFSNAFHCPVGSKMNPAKKCEIF